MAASQRERPGAPKSKWVCMAPGFTRASSTAWFFSEGAAAQMAAVKAQTAALAQSLFMRLDPVLATIVFSKELAQDGRGVKRAPRRTEDFPPCLGGAHPGTLRF
jgi:hypothetical protein